MARTKARASIIGTIASAFRAANSMREGAQPNASDLDKLGINAADFRRTTRR